MTLWQRLRAVWQAFKRGTPRTCTINPDGTFTIDDTRAKWAYDPRER